MADELDTQEFADGIVDSTLETLRDQEDDEQLLQLYGTLSFNPQIFRNLNASYQSLAPGVEHHFRSKQLAGMNATQASTVLGPVRFKTRYSALPSVTFGQAIESTLAFPVALQTSSRYTPFVCIPFVHSFVWANGEVDGFYMGLYALTGPPLDITTHTLSWVSTGKGSRYREQGVEESWDQAYDYNDSTFLEEDVTGEEVFE